MKLPSSPLALLAVLVFPVSAAPLIHYVVNEDDAAAVAGGAVPNLGTLGAGVTGSFGNVISLSSGTPSNGVPGGLGDRSLDCNNTGGVNAPGTQHLLNTDIAAAGGFTYETWLNWEGGGTFNSVIDYAGTEQIIFAGATLQMGVNNTNYESLFSPTPFTWHYVAVVFETSNAVAGDGSITGDFTYYLDGITPLRTVENVSISTFGDSLTRTIGVGMHPAGFAGNFFDGRLYSPRVTLGALEPSELLWATTRTVTNTDDSGPGSLRDTIASADPGDIIAFDPSLSGQTITLTSGILFVTDLTIDASDLPSGVTISGGGTQGVFTVFGSGLVTFRHLVLTDGMASSGAAIDMGTATTAIVDGCHLSGNRSEFENGALGGALRCFGTVEIRDSSLTDNDAGVSGQGGAVFVGSNGSLKAVNTTFARNQAAFRGSAIYAFGTIELESCTVTLNESLGSSPNAGAIYCLSIAPTVNRSIVAENKSSNSNNNNFDFLNPVGSNNLIGGDPMLGGLASHGGITPCLLPLPGSPAIDSAPTSADSPAADQRGIQRPSLFIPEASNPPLNHTEAANGDISSTPGEPVLDLSVGTNVVSGTVGPTGGGETSDQFALNLPNGLLITSVTVNFDNSNGTTGNIGFGNGTPSSSGGPATENFSPPLTGGQYSVSVSTDFAIEPKAWSISVVVAAPPVLNDIGAAEATWDEGLAGSPPAGFGTHSDITSAADPFITLPGEDRVDSFTDAIDAINNGPGHFAVYPDPDLALDAGMDIRPLLGKCRLIGLTLRNRAFDPSHPFDPATFVLLGYNEPGAPHLLSSGIVPPFTSPGATQTFYFENATSRYRGFRLIFPSVIDDNLSSGTVQIEEIELLGKPDDTNLRILDFQVDPATLMYDLTFASIPGNDYHVERGQTLISWPPAQDLPVPGSGVLEFSHKVTGGPLSAGKDFVRVEDD